MASGKAAGGVAVRVEATVGPETGWLVERHDRGQVEYLRIDNCGDGYAWHTDSLKATRFARRQDAEHAAEGGELLDLRIAEHMWCERPNTSLTGGLAANEVNDEQR